MHPQRSTFIRAACVPRDTSYPSHASGTLAEANDLLGTHPELATLDIHTAAILGDDVTVARLLEEDASLSAVTSDPYGWDALTHLCFSRYLRLDASRSDAFVRAARALLDAGASANTGFFESDHQPAPTRESVLYGVAGIAHHEALTRLLLDRGADPNDDEVPYHSPEGYDLGAFRALLASRRMSPASLSTMLLRKSDWHDRDGMALALDFGADANAIGHWGRSPLSHAIRSDNRADIVELLIDRGADPTRVEKSTTAIAMAAWAGRSDLLRLFERRGFSITPDGLDGVVVAITLGDAPRADQLVRETPALADEVRAHAPMLMVRFAGVGNAKAIAMLLDRGVPVNSAEPMPDGYHDRASNATALHVAAWRARHELVEMLIAREADVNARDGAERTPLMLAVRACVESYWVDEKSTRSIAALLDAGAEVAGVRFPSGYDDADALLAARGATPSATGRGA